jgi:mevalonate kinase
MSFEATAPGKVILFGEHSVVYRGPAVVLAIDKRARVTASRRTDKRVFIDADDLGFSGFFENGAYTAVTGDEFRGKNLSALDVAARKVMDKLGVSSGVDLVVRSSIPIAVGLGSSAAVCVATTAAVAGLFDGKFTLNEIADLSFEGEKVIHGTPSGVDNNVSTFGGIMRYERGKEFERLKMSEALPFVIGNTRRRRSTKNQVENVKALRDRNPAEMDEVIDLMGQISRRGLSALLNRDLPKIGDLMNINHGLLSGIGVSTEDLDRLVHASRRSGALGAKLTGAGGGGCMIALAEEDKLPAVERAIRQAHGQALRVNLTDKGVETRRIEAGSS